jgi:hypothetical protein
MILGIDPKIDFAFKYLFGRDSTRDILIDAVNSVLQPPPGQAVQEAELLNPFNLQETLDDKLSVLDIKARDQAGRQFNVEMQILARDTYSGIAGRAPAAVNHASRRGIDDADAKRH